MLNNIEIRNATANDAQAIIDYCNIVGGESDNLSFGGGEFYLSVKEEQEFLNKQDQFNICVVAVSDGAIIAAANLSSIERPRFKHNATLGISVLKQYHGQGVGTRMITELLKQISANNITENIILEVRSDNYAAIKLYERFGFEKVGCLPRNINVGGQYFDIDIMHKQLTVKIK
ncbi:N-acetyltransferase [Mollicutes bacterium LVI A0039]|nr:N-acetyltransferase [Mollicutes bacterium LVI A0039]